MKGDRRLSLNSKLLIVQLGSLCLALAVFLTGMTAGRWFLDHHYLSPEACYRRKLEYALDLNGFVQENDLASTDTAELEMWAQTQKYVYLALYRGETPVLETNGYETADLPGLGELRNEQLYDEEEAVPEGLGPDEDGYFRLHFRDGYFRVGIAEFSETPYYDAVVILSLTSACVALLAVNLLYNRRVTRSIIRLSHEVQWVEKGCRDAAITSDCTDEIGELAKAVERMRRSIIQRMKSEQDALSANSGLITAISHDIRTPLTALIGYLDLLEGKQYQNEEQMERYLHASRGKALQLKELTDELFRYFLVYASPEVKMDLQVYDAVILSEQMLGEQIIRLQENGFTVRVTMLEQPCFIRIDVQYLQRVLDNVFSNIQKHGDKSRQVSILLRLEAGNLKVDIVNSIPARPNPVESTKIGLQTCRKILKEMGGVFETQQEGRSFLVELTFPLAEEEAEEKA